jgi:branched-subunit amino acid ABC-type transport system permease component
VLVLGLSLFIEDVARVLWGAEQVFTMRRPLSSAMVTLLFFCVLLCGCIVSSPLWYTSFFSRTYLGKAVRAVTQIVVALLVGVNMAQVGILTCGIGTMLAIAGVFYMLL